MTETPFHQHDCDCCKYLGSKEYSPQMNQGQSKIDMYMCDQNGLATVIGRFGTGPDYFSSLGLPKMLARELIKDKEANDYPSALKVIIDKSAEEFDVQVLSQAALLAVEKGYLNEQLISTNPSKKPKKK